MIDRARAWIGDHPVIVALAVGASVAAVAGGYVDTSQITNDIPEWWPAALIGLVAAAIGAKIGGSRITDLLPEDDGILIVAFASDGMGGEIWEVSDDRFEQMEVVPEDGTLMRWDSARPVIEVRDYDPDANRAVANWRVPGSQLAEHETVDEALDAIDELRSRYETDARRGRWIRRRLPSILRTLDRDRAEDQMRAIESHVAPAIGDSDTISEVIRRDMPDELIPESHRRAADMSDTDDLKDDTDADEITNDTDTDTTDMTDSDTDTTDDAQTGATDLTGADTSEAET
ncbi:hypothetical protein DJ78_05015 [Halorubrum ezzemoulense]|uniref:DUF8125 domain-containing protein n=2 Tax=Halorubrum ezzemoulense TaxID=337243 RepID=A0A256JSP1_HALEZ|nr:hypothetical protein DJ78_05015 [Halorubrum ezzemoulense]